jgi:predicted phosphodiesterase
VRIAIVSDIHGNRTAFEAVLADLRQTAPDLILHGGDLADSGASPADIIDRIRDLGWPGIVGNTDEMLFDPESLARFAAPLPQLQPMFAAIEEMAAAARAALGDHRLAWLRALPRMQIHAPLALVHATPASLWKAPMPTAADIDLETAYGPLVQPVVVYGHIHQPYVRTFPGLTVANSGSVGQPHDGDPRASYLLLDGAEPSIRRVAYDVEREIRALTASRLPHSEWIARIIRSARPQPLAEG